MAQNGLGAAVEGALGELLQSSLDAIGANCALVYLKVKDGDAILPVAAWGTALPSDETTRLARRTIVNNELVVIQEEAPASPQAIDGTFLAFGVPLVGETKGALLLGFGGYPGGDAGPGKKSLSLLLARLAEAHLRCADLKQALDQHVRATMEAQEAEREWIGLEVHDGVTQTLVSAFQLLQAYEGTPVSRLREARPHLLRAVALVREAIRESREVINRITPAPLSKLGLVTTLRQELRRLEEDTGCRTRLDAPRIRLPKETEVVLYRIVHEAVTNVRRHAQSERLQVEIRQTGDRVVIRIEDSGVGFDPTLVERSSIGRNTGLFSMRKRAEILGGFCQIKTQPGQGTEVIVDVPLRPWVGSDGKD